MQHQYTSYIPSAYHFAKIFSSSNHLYRPCTSFYYLYKLCTSSNHLYRPCTSFYYLYRPCIFSSISLDLVLIFAICTDSALLLFVQTIHSFHHLYKDCYTFISYLSRACYSSTYHQCRFCSSTYKLYRARTHLTYHLCRPCTSLDYHWYSACYSSPSTYPYRSCILTYSLHRPYTPTFCTEPYYTCAYYVYRFCAFTYNTYSICTLPTIFTDPVLRTVICTVSENLPTICTEPLLPLVLILQVLLPLPIAISIKSRLLVPSLRTNGYMCTFGSPSVQGSVFPLIMCTQIVY